ncbi:hypothetical protein [Methanococcoides sp. FTZ1]|uniref:hypothetical protein n=1 Tax=Methanococcoides sp. FTZ1 TaxID=3439061 RepID=UPI003F825E6D
MSLKLNCEICRDEFIDHNPDLKHCPSCQGILNRYKKSKRYNYPSVKAALREAFSHKDSENVYFKCEYTGIISKFNDGTGTVGHFKDPFVLTLDHEYSKKNRVVVSLNLVNKIKGDIPPTEFKRIIMALGDFFNSVTVDKTKASEKLEDELKEICTISQ